MNDSSQGLQLLKQTLKLLATPAILLILKVIATITLSTICVIEE